MSNQSAAEVLECFREAIAPLTWMSESDYPFEVRLVQNLPPSATATELVPATPGTAGEPRAVTEISLTQMLGAAAQERDWHGQEERAIARRFQHLLQLIQTHLHDVHVFSVGTVEIDLHVVGKTVDDGWLILSTKAIET